MDLITELNLAIEYMEENLMDQMALEDVASVTSYSSYHFQRIFNYITGIPLSEYIRRRKLSLAVFDLQNGEKVIDVAIKYGYNSADSFTRAFTKQHGVTPSQMKKESVSFNIYPPMTFQLTVKGAEKMTCRIETKKAFNMFGTFIEIDENEKEAQEAVASFLKRCVDDNTYSEMNTIFGYDKDTLLHSAIFDHRENKFKYMLCQYMRDGIYVSDQYMRLHIPAGQWAVFSTNYCEVSALWERVYSEWLPNSGYELINSTAFEMYYGNRRKGEKRGEIWVPIKHKTTVPSKIIHGKLRCHKLEDDEMCGRFKVVDFIYEEQWKAPLYQLWEAVNKKYPEGIYWNYNPRSNEGKHVFLCLDDNNKVIGKGHTMVFEKQDDNAPGYAEHRIFIHYRVLPDYEQEEQVLDLLYGAVFNRALELRKGLSNRACQLCIGNYDKEEVYNAHIQKKGWPEHGSIYHLTAPTKVMNHYREENVVDVTFKEFDLAKPHVLTNLVTNDQVCFRNSISGLDTYQNITENEYIAYGALANNDRGVEIIVGSVIVEIDEKYTPEIVSVMVLPEYRRKHIAAIMLEYILDELNKKGKEKVWLVTPCDNDSAILMYKKLGFSIESHEKRYMKYI